MAEQNGELFRLSLRTRQDKLERLLHQPESFIDDYFRSLRRQIDLDAEDSLEKLDSNEAQNDRADLVTKHRMRLIDYLEKQETILKRRLAQLDRDLLSPFVDKLKRFRGEIEEFLPTTNRPFDLEEECELLEAEIRNEKTNLEKIVMNSQSFIFVNKYQIETFKIYYDNEEMTSLTGFLINLEKYYISNESVEEDLYTWSLSEGKKVLKKSDLNLNARNITLFFICFKELKCKLLKDHCRGNYTNLSILVVEAITAFINKYRTARGAAQNNPPTNDSWMDDSVLFDRDLIDYFSTKDASLYLKHQRFLHLDSEFFDLLVGLPNLTLSDNRIVNFKQDDFKKLTSLETLHIENAFAIGTIYELDFVEQLTKLTALSITVPESGLDFRILANLEALKDLHVLGEANRDANIMKAQIDREVFSDILLPQLCNLMLKYFEIEEIPEFAFAHMTNLRDLDISHCKINLLSNRAFGRIPNTSIIFSHNSIESNCMSEDTSCICADEKQSEHSISVSLVNNSMNDILSGLLDNFPTKHDSPNDCNQTGKMKHLTDLFLKGICIESSSFDLISICFNLRHLTLKNCGLKSFNNTVFNGLLELISLDLSENEIDSIELDLDAKKKPLKLSSQAELSDEEFELVKSNLFTGLQKLRYLSLSHNHLEKIDLNCFCNLKRLGHLHLSNNRITHLNSSRPADLSLRMLDLSSNQLTALSSRILRNSATNYSELDLSNNKIKFIEEGFFDSLTNIDELNLSNNQLDIVFDKSTFSSPNPHCLKLQNNQSVQYKLDFFSREQILSIDFPLDLLNLLDKECYSDNAQQRKPNSCLKDLSVIEVSTSSTFDIDLGDLFPSLVKVRLSKCNIVDFKPSWIAGLAFIKELDLSDNRIKRLEGSWFKSNNQLTLLNLSGNRLEPVDRHSFSCLTKLKRLDLSRNENLHNFKADTFSDLAELEEINLSSNQITHIDLKELFVQNTDLKVLDLSNNFLDDQSINKRVFVRSNLETRLTHLRLGNNRLKNIEFIRDLTRLEELLLESNMIESIFDPDGQNLFGRLVKLECIVLSSNRIHCLSADDFAHLKHQLTRLDVSNNPRFFRQT